jgi:hypothetical protein
MLSQPDMALASTTAITLPVLNQQDLAAKSTEALPAWLEDSPSVSELERPARQCLKAKVSTTESLILSGCSERETLSYRLSGATP